MSICQASKALLRLYAVMFLLNCMQMQLCCVSLGGDFVQACFAFSRIEPGHSVRTFASIAATTGSSQQSTPVVWLVLQTDFARTCCKVLSDLNDVCSWLWSYSDSETLSATGVTEGQYGSTVVKLAGSRVLAVCCNSLACGRLCSWDL